LPKDRYFIINLIIVFLLFATTGFISGWIYFHYHEDGGIFFPGLLYTSGTGVVLLLAQTKFSFKGFLQYYFLMELCYVVIYYLTLLSSWFAPFCGIATAGAGALLSFIIMDKYVTPISYDKWKTFWVGGIAFVLTDTVHFTAGRGLLSYYFNEEASIWTLYTDIFIFWQVMVGIYLLITLHKNSQVQEQDGN
jgi:hypothetical protein